MVSLCHNHPTPTGMLFIPVKVLSHGLPRWGPSLCLWSPNRFDINTYKFVAWNKGRKLKYLALIPHFHPAASFEPR